MAEDWSLVRSPSRARRRLKQGHRQNIRWLEDLVVGVDYGIKDRTVRAILLREDTGKLRILSLEVTP